VSPHESSAQQSYPQVKFRNGSITYHGFVDDKLLFNLSVQNKADSKLAVVILDENGDRIFRGTFKGKKIEKLFKIPGDTYSMTFIISDPEDKSERHFKIHSKRRYVEDITVTKLL
jgi:hypothetical protein